MEDLYKEIKITPQRKPKPPVRQKAYRGFSTINPENASFQLFDIGLIKQDLINHFNIRQGEKLSDPTLYERSLNQNPRLINQLFSYLSRA